MSEKIKDQAGRIMKFAQARRATLATVESCTAGALALLLSQAEGASDTLHGGFIVYTKDNKTAAVGVPKELIAAHTAVSAEVAKAMASGGLARCPADIVVAITGVAAPSRMRTATRSALSMWQGRRAMAPPALPAMNSESAIRMRFAGQPWARPSPCSKSW